MMRHASIEITLHFYTHTLIEDKDKAARALPDLGLQNENGAVDISAGGKGHAFPRLGHKRGGSAKA